MKIQLLSQLNYKLSGEKVQTFLFQDSRVNSSIYLEGKYSL